jgi:hypothetical protein
MAVVDRSTATADGPDTARVSVEADMIAAVEASLLAGRVIPHQEFRAWSRGLFKELEAFAKFGCDFGGWAPGAFL